MKKNELTKKNNKVSNSTLKLKKIGLPILGVIAALLLLAGGIYGYLYASTPAHIRNPAYEHYHIRTQIIANGQPIDFSTNDFQEEYDASTCSAGIPELPIDFHDGENQMTHIHWSGITGGELLKYYGWNLIGGEDNSLGRRYDQGMMRVRHVETKGNIFPELSEDASFYVYIGEENNYRQKDWSDFLNMDLEEFFGTKSHLNTDESSFNILDLFSTQVYAHGGVDDGDSDDPLDFLDQNKKAEEPNLESLNNLIGNLVIFVQKEQPTENEIQERFNNLAPLHESTCGG